MKGIALSLAALCISAVSLNTHAINCDTIPQWDSAAVYTKDMQAQEAQKVYKANWWSQNHNPVNYSGQWQEWTYLGDCDVAVNRPPVAVLSISQASSSGSYPVQYTYTFNGTGSHDPDGKTKKKGLG
jgi:chitinase